MIPVWYHFAILHDKLFFFNSWYKKYCVPQDLRFARHYSCLPAVSKIPYQYVRLRRAAHNAFAFTHICVPCVRVDPTNQGNALLKCPFARWRRPENKQRDFQDTIDIEWYYCCVLCHASAQRAAAKRDSSNRIFIFVINRKSIITRMHTQKSHMNGEYILGFTNTTDTAFKRTLSAFQIYTNIPHTKRKRRLFWTRTKYYILPNTNSHHSSIYSSWSKCVLFEFSF